jgi:hypothetical protein
MAVEIITVLGNGPDRLDARIIGTGQATHVAGPCRFKRVNALW